MSDSDPSSCLNLMMLAVLGLSFVTLNLLSKLSSGVLLLHIEDLSDLLLDYLLNHLFDDSGILHMEMVVLVDLWLDDGHLVDLGLRRFHNRRGQLFWNWMSDRAEIRRKDSSSLESNRLREGLELRDDLWLLNHLDSRLDDLNLCWVVVAVVVLVDDWLGLQSLRNLLWFFLFLLLLFFGFFFLFLFFFLLFLLRARTGATRLSLGRLSLRFRRSRLGALIVRGL